MLSRDQRVGLHARSAVSRMQGGVMKHPRWWTRCQPFEEGWYFWKRNRNWRPIMWRCFYVTFYEKAPTFWEAGTAVCMPKGGHWSMIRPEALEDV